MMTPGLWAILDELAVTTTHLHVVQLLQSRPQLQASAGQIAELLCRDIWSVAAALDDLCGLRVCERAGSDAAAVLYRYAPSEERQHQILQLLRAFEDPLLRDQLQRRIRSDRHSGRPQQRGDGFRTGRFGEHGLLLTEL
jgi:hypothetical protein